MPIRLIVGLGNPGEKYRSNRHNVGFWFLEQINKNYNGLFKKDLKFFGYISKVFINNHLCWLLKPDTFMNLSGQAVQSLMHFYKIQHDELLILHDELDLSVGNIRLKTGGGHGGHNGLRDIINHIGTRDFHRLRIGISHPGNAKVVSSYVLSNPNSNDTISIKNVISSTQQYMSDIIAGNFEKVMNQLHNKG